MSCGSATAAGTGHTTCCVVCDLACSNVAKHLVRKPTHLARKRTHITELLVLRMQTATQSLETGPVSVYLAVWLSRALCYDLEKLAA